MYPLDSSCGIKCLIKNQSCIFSDTKSCALRSAFISGLQRRRKIFKWRYRKNNSGVNQSSPLSEYFALLKVYLLTGFKCWYCGEKMELLTDDRFNPRHYTFDHRTSLKNGGDNLVSNMVICCMECNQKKSIEE